MDSCSNRSNQMYNPQRSYGSPSCQRAPMGNEFSPNHNRMNVSCSIPKTNDSTSKSVYYDDPMEQLGESFPVGMSYTPWQQWKDIYPTNIALVEGTIFMELNKEFIGVRC